MNFFIHKLLGWREHFPDGQYKLLEILDSRTSQVCRDHHGKKYAVKAAKVGENFPPLHPWCRSSVVLVFDEIAKPVTISLPATKHYVSVKEEWLNRQGTEAKVEKAESVTTLNGETFTAENAKLVHTHDLEEQKVAEWLAKLSNDIVQILPEIKMPEGKKMADFLFREEHIDLKRITSKKGGC